MAKINLPNPESNDSKQNDKGSDDSNAVQQQLDMLASQVELMNADRKDVVDDKKKADEEKRQQQLSAEADLKALLDSAEQGDSDTSGSRKVDDLSNSQLLDVISNAVDTAINARSTQLAEQVDKKIKVTSEGMDKVVKVLGQMQASAGIQSARGKHSDFDKLKDDTLAVLKIYPMMDVEHAYLLGKQMRVADSPSRQETDSEKPIVTPFGVFGDRTEVKKESKKPETMDTRGTVGFRNIVNKALKDLDVSKGR